MLCPRCKIELYRVKLKGMVVDTCTTCEGIWFDKDELTGVLGAFGIDLKSSPLARSLDSNVTRYEKSGQKELPCPRCHEKMLRYKYAITSGVLVDGCEQNHGVWVDDGEITKIFNYLVEARKPLSPGKKAEIDMKLEVIKLKSKEKEKTLIDSLVSLDDHPGSFGFFGELFQVIYTIFNKIGI